MIEEQKCLAFVGTGEGLLPYIYKAKEMGIKTVLFARGKDTFARDQIDIFVEENNFDIKYMAAKCKELHVDGIMAFTDFTTEIAAKVAHEAGLPGNDVEPVFAGRNKNVMRCRVQNLKSVKQPKFELYDETHEYEFPVVVKAVDSAGKRGVSLAKDKEEFITAVKYAQDNSSDGSALIEEYLEGGQEYSIECIVSNGVCQIVQYTQKDSAGAPHFVELGHHQPAPLTQIEREKINKAIKDILSVLGIRCGMAHVELKIINGDVYFIEVGARAGGGHIADTLVALSTDFDYFKAAILASIGEYVPKKINNIAHVGLYYYCKQNQNLLQLFDSSKNANWCFDKHFVKHDLYDITCNAQAWKSGYIIYASDSKIDFDNYNNESNTPVIELNKFPNAYKMLWDYYKENNSKLSDQNLDSAVKNVLNNGKVLSIIKNYKITDCIVLSNDRIYTYPELLDVVDFEDSSYIDSNQSLLLNKAISILKKQ